MAQFDSSWRNYKPQQKPGAPARVDRGTGRGAKRCIVDWSYNILDYHIAKSAGIKGDHFQSRSEAKRFVGLSTMMKAGGIRPDPAFGGKWRQVAFPLRTRNHNGLDVVVAKLVLDFVYQVKQAQVEESPIWIPGGRGGGGHELIRPLEWVTIYEDVKPSGGHREDTYKLKKHW